MTTEIFFPKGVKVQGNQKIIAMTSVASDAAPSVATDLGAATSVELTEAAYGNWDAPVNVDTGSAPTRIGTQSVLPEEGNANRQVIPLAVPVDPSKPKSDPVNKAWALLTQGAILKVFVRNGISKNIDFAVDDPGLTYTVRVGYVPPEPGRTGDDAFAEYQIATNLIPLGEPVEATLVA